MGFSETKRGFGKNEVTIMSAAGNPLTLTNVKRLRSVSVSGSSAQSGTPSPDSPAEVLGTGERTWNLFDASSISGSNIEVKGTDIYLSGYACSTNTSPEKFMEMTGTTV